MGFNRVVYVIDKGFIGKEKFIFIGGIFGSRR